MALSMIILPIFTRISLMPTNSQIALIIRWAWTPNPGAFCWTKSLKEENKIVKSISTIIPKLATLIYLPSTSILRKEIMVNGSVFVTVKVTNPIPRFIHGPSKTRRTGAKLSSRYWISTKTISISRDHNKPEVSNSAKSSSHFDNASLFNQNTFKSLQCFWKNTANNCRMWFKFGFH